MNCSLRTTLLAAAAAAFLLGCPSKNQNAAGGTSAAGPKPDTVVATWGDGKKLTLAEVDEHAADELQQLEDQKYELRRRTVEQMVIQSLVQAEAAKKGMTEEQYLKAEIEAQVPAPPDEELKKMFDAAKDRLPPGATFEEYRERIVDASTRSQKQERARKLFDDLRAQAKLEVKLEQPPKPRKQVEAKGPARGPADAKVTIVEFSDFECPYCSRAHDTVEQVMEAYAGKVRLVFRHFPLDFHKSAPKAAEASLCADEQGKFWEYHDVLFKNQQKLQVADLKEHAKTLGLDTGKFDGCIDSAKFASAVQQDIQAAKKVGIQGTPAFFINGVLLSGAQPFEEFKKVIDQELGTN